MTNTTFTKRLRTSILSAALATAALSSTSHGQETQPSMSSPPPPPTVVRQEPESSFPWGLAGLLGLLGLLGRTKKQTDVVHEVGRSH